MRIGLLTDTHLPGIIRTLDELGPLPGEFLSSVDLILHGGDLTSPIVLDWCEQFAPVICSTGNNDQKAAGEIIILFFSLKIIRGIKT